MDSGGLASSSSSPSSSSSSSLSTSCDELASPPQPASHDRTSPTVFSDVDVLHLSTRDVISKIEIILESIIDALQDNRALSIPMRSRPSGNQVVIRFPSTNAAEVKRFNSILTVLSISREALVSNTVVTKRNIYYQNPGLFGTQNYVDKIVDDVAFTLGVGRFDLNIVAASKGLIAGTVLVISQDGSITDCSLDSNGTAVPEPALISEFDVGSTEWILVIEKEATFRSLAVSRYFQFSLAGAGIIVTAKGYPDLSTRQFLYRLHLSYLHIPIYALVDFDPAGISIMRTYKFGSPNLGHERFATVPGLSWLGLKSSDFLDRNLQSSGGDLNSSTPQPHQSPEPAESLLPLTIHDRRKATNLIKNLVQKPSIENDEVEQARELQIMLLLNIKAEIQAVEDARPIADWLDERLLCAAMIES